MRGLYGAALGGSYLVQVAVQGATHHTPRPPPHNDRSSPPAATSAPLFDCVFYSQRYAKDSKGTEAIRGNGSIFSRTHHRSKGCAMYRLVTGGVFIEFKNPGVLIDEEILKPALSRSRWPMPEGPTEGHVPAGLEV